jgi:hypothetical protein
MLNLNLKKGIIIHYPSDFSVTHQVRHQSPHKDSAGVEVGDGFEVLQLFLPELKDFLLERGLPPIQLQHLKIIEINYNVCNDAFIYLFFLKGKK